MNKTLTSDESRLKRLKFRSWHRGWKETDLILGGFADAQLHTLNDTLLAQYEALLDLDDDVIWNWVIGKSAPSPEFKEIVALIRQSANA